MDGFSILRSPHFNFNLKRNVNNDSGTLEMVGHKGQSSIDEWYELKNGSIAVHTVILKYFHIITKHFLILPSSLSKHPKQK